MKIQILTWKSNNQLYGTNIQNCHEVQKDVHVLKVPHSKKYISGIVNLRGEILTVLDLPAILGLKEKANDGNSVIIRMKNKSKQIALKVDSIEQVLNITSDKIEDASLHLNGKELEFIPQVAYSDSGFILLLDIEKLFIVR